MVLPADVGRAAVVEEGEEGRDRGGMVVCDGKKAVSGWWSGEGRRRGIGGRGEKERTVDGVFVDVVVHAHADCLEDL